jgi:YfiH family protein
MPNDFIIPDWPAPSNVRALVTSRQGGVSKAPYVSLNLGDHVGDDPEAVAANRALLRALLPSEPVWLKQVHDIQIANADHANGVPEADGSVARKPGRVSAVLTADCLPALLCDRAGTVVASAHAGWRGLAGGVLEAAVQAMAVPSDQLLVWLGPAIGPRAFEVGVEVRDAFTALIPEAQQAFVPHAEGKWLADIYLLARQRLERMGVGQIYGGNFCTYTDAERFYSYRRDGVTGRMASLIWLEAD